MDEGDAAGALAEGDEGLGLFVADPASLLFDFGVVGDDFVGQAGQDVEGTIHGAVIIILLIYYPFYLTVKKLTIYLILTFLTVMTSLFILKPINNKANNDNSRDLFVDELELIDG